MSSGSLDILLHMQTSVFSAAVLLCQWVLGADWRM